MGDGAELCGVLQLVALLAHACRLHCRSQLVKVDLALRVERPPRRHAAQEQRKVGGGSEEMRKTGKGV